MISRETNHPALDSTEVLNDILDAMRRGEEVDVEALTEQHPESADDIRQLHAVVSLVRNAAERIDPGSDLDAMLKFGRRPPVVGDFRIVREIARGGMGVVYEARQISLDRRVALKVLLPGVTYSRTTLERFMREARTAGALHHSNIVPVYAVGEHDDVPYYAMQFIEGHSLDALIRAWRDEKTPPDATHARRVARWGLDVARALAYAHAHGVIHRDVKPSNILIGDDEQVWITDFGLARRDVGATITLSGDLVGTVRYMSPEQARGGGVVDERSDVYSLGATLYEMLALRPVFEGDDRQAVLKQVLLDTPDPLAGRVPASARPLTSIIHTALSKSPDHRYASAALLAEDLERFLEDRPLLVQPPGPLTLFWRFVARHRVPVATLFGVMLVLLALVGVLAVQTGRLAAQRDRAEGETVRAERTSEFLQSMIAFANPRYAGTDVSMRTVLDEMAARIDAELRDEPLIELDVREAIGGAYFNMSRFEDAHRHLRRALVLRREHVGDDDQETVCAAIELSQVLGYLDRVDDAVDLLREFCDIVPDRHVERPHLLAELAAMLSARDDSEEALRLVDDAIALTRARYGMVHEEVAVSLEHRASILGDLGRTTDMIDTMREVVETKSAALGADDPRVAEALGLFCQSLLFDPTDNHLREAEAAARRAVAIMTAHRGPDHTDTLWVRRQLANVLAVAGRPDAAEALYRELLEAYRAMLGPEHFETALTLEMLGRFFAGRGRVVEARTHYEQSLAIRRTIMGVENAETRRLEAVIAELDGRQRP